MAGIGGGSSGGGGGGGGGGGVAGVAGKGIATVPKLGPYDPTGDLIGQILGAANGGLDTPGSPGSGGGMVSNAALRASLQQSAAQSEADRANVYNQVNQAILGRAGGISDSFDRAGQTLETNAQQRAAADQASVLQRQSNAAQAAAAYGLSGVPGTTGDASAANQAMLNAQQAYKAIADSWQGFDQASKGSALERNNMTADSFAHMGLQQQANLQSELSNALGKAADYFVRGSGGSKGSSLSPTSKLAALEYVLNFGQKQSAAKAASTPKTSITTSKSSLGKDGSKNTTSKTVKG